MNQSTIRKMSDRKRPHVKLAGEDGNAFAILARVREAMREVGWTRAEIAESMDSMTSSDYDHLLVVACELCKVD